MMHTELTHGEAKLHARKVAAELKTGNGLVFLPGEPTRTWEYSDQALPFRQRRYFYYLSGADLADCAVTYDLATDHLTLWIPYVEPRQVLWNGRTPSLDECLEKSAVDSVRYTRELSAFLHAYIHQQDDPIIFLLDRTQAPVELDSDFLARSLVKLDVASLKPAMDEARVIKTDYEIDLIRKANEISSAAHRAVRDRLADFTNEREVEALFHSECALRRAKRQAYPVIAGSGDNAATLHYEANDQPLADKQFLVLDAGCEYACYASDVTRTLPLTDALSSESRTIYRLVQRMQQACIDAVRPGVLFYSLHLRAAHLALTVLHRIGILKGHPDKIWLAGTVAAFFPHGLGHHIGLETHDVSGRDRLLLSRFELESLGLDRGNNNASRSAKAKRQFVSPETLVAMHSGQYGIAWKPDETEETSTAAAPPPPYSGRQKLGPGMVVTVEPGIYFCREYIEGYFLRSDRHKHYIDVEQLERYYHVGGVRIEDDILVTETGYENLTSAPKVI
ncbi:Creatinase/aminopeptidase [Sodiomyces alkalinus F11]|uniref:Xaa-Pro aminopeptidase n=1 Tax=Sodiomyces alkalinus (strain CBS 110278 / VKM F-3762 / F11) TaxID=1314773 RepID=A0A3N2Q7N9_SODAK|nr:Creatinase/aminopeptidase [Sodiomyces alkalinus F11]ROT42762.1 Creatinase/aminopeptidase [Sodiomyces alkalinus F11]